MDRGANLAEVLPGYEIGVELGRGAFGVVISGRHRQLGREVAIKQLAPGLVGNQSAKARFLSEAKVLASIEHPHIVPVYDYVEHDETCALVMERLGGGTVWRRFVERGYDPRTACAISLVACSGLHGAHRNGVLHRDMKPENVLFGVDRSLKVTDFGIARVVGENDALAARDGELLGTPAYMAPEQASGSDLGPPTDVFAVGVMLYELLTGRLPYPDDGGSLATVLRHMNEDPTPISDVSPGVPANLAEVVMRALARDPADRFQSAEEFGVAIGEAAAATWGVRWIEGLDVSLREPGPILESARSRGSVAIPASDATGGGVVRPEIDLHTAGGADTGLVLSDLMPLRQTPAEVPAFPRALIWAAGAAAVLALVLGLLGVGSASPSANPAIARGSVSVAGHDPAAGGRIPVDLDRQIPIFVRSLPAGNGVPQTAQMVLSLGGVPVVHSTSAPFIAGRRGYATVVDASAGRYVVGGKLSARLELIGSRGTVIEHFGLDAARSPFGTFVGVFGILLTLVVAAYFESMLRTLRRGRRRGRRANAAGLVVVGAAGGIALALWGWMLEISSPTLSCFVLLACVGAAAGLLSALAGLQVGDRAFATRQANRLVLVARRRTTSVPVAVPGPATAGAGT